MPALRVSIFQGNFTVGGIEDNAAKIKNGIDRAVESSADLVVFPEMALTGYPPEDLVFKPQFIEANLKALDGIVRYTAGKPLMVVCGYINKEIDIFNSAAVIHDGALVDSYNKIFLPNYGVFDEIRYFTAGDTIPVYVYGGVRIGVSICEDAWYPTGPLHSQALAGGAELVVNISASPYQAGKQGYRETMFSARAGDESVILVNCNLVGGQDELVFDGGSTAYDENGALVCRMKSFEEDFQAFDINSDSVFRRRLKDIRRRQEKKEQDSPFRMKTVEIAPDKVPPKAGNCLPRVLPEKSAIESIYAALVLGTADYVNKNGFRKVIVAISGGIDSAMVAAIAVDALGSERVKGIYLPSQFSAGISGEDARALAANLDIELFELPIGGLYDGYNALLAPVFKGMPFSVAEENLQSRIRGNIVMALSNKFNWLVLTTGNKSEMSTGYATLYGDMAGGFAVIKDVLKTVVYELAAWRNSTKPVIPARIIERPPSAELRPDQKDTDSLPEYPVLDRIIRDYVENDLPLDEIVRNTGDAGLVRKVVRMIDMSEYKRRQSPPGIKITPRAFGRDRRMPVTNGFRVS